MQADYEDALAQWLAWVRQRGELATDSTGLPYQRNSNFRKILAMGPPVLPYLMESIRKHEGTMIGAVLESAFLQISKYRYSPEEKERIIAHLRTHRISGDTAAFLAQAKPLGSHLPEWWDSEDVYQRIESGFAESYRLLAAASSKESVELARQQIKNYGVFAIPYAVDILAEGKEQDDGWLLECLNYWTDNEVEEYRQQEADSGKPARVLVQEWWDENQREWICQP